MRLNLQGDLVGDLIELTSDGRRLLATRGEAHDIGALVWTGVEGNQASRGGDEASGEAALEEATDEPSDGSVTSTDR